MTMLVIILAQGQQTRLPGLSVSKTMLPLFVFDAGLDRAPYVYPFVGVERGDLEARYLAAPRSTRTPHITIMERTLAQLAWMRMRWEIDDLDVRVIASPESLREICVLGDGVRGRMKSSSHDHFTGQAAWKVWLPDWLPGGEASRIRGISFSNPRNSSLRGIADTMCALVTDGYLPLGGVGIDLQIVVLFGDTVYSWDCLRALVHRDGPRAHQFVVSPNLTRSTGEVWGLSWHMEDDRPMRQALAAALRKHPPVDDTYQAGQMRRWLFELCDQDLGRMPDHSRFTRDNDYTRDIDLPSDINLLPSLAAAALADDEKNGLLHASPAADR